MSMDETALRELAESMGMKKSSTDNKEETAYFIIRALRKNVNRAPDALPLPLQ